MIALCDIDFGGENYDFQGDGLTISTSHSDKGRSIETARKNLSKFAKKNMAIQKRLPNFPIILFEASLKLSRNHGHYGW